MSCVTQLSKPTLSKSEQRKPTGIQTYPNLYTKPIKCQQHALVNPDILWNGLVPFQSLTFPHFFLGELDISGSISGLKDKNAKNSSLVVNPKNSFLSESTS